MTSSDNKNTTEFEQDVEIILSRASEPTIPAWIVFKCPSWFVNFCFWIKRVIRRFTPDPNKDTPTP